MSARRTRPVHWPLLALCLLSVTLPLAAQDGGGRSDRAIQSLLEPLERRFDLVRMFRSIDGGPPGSFGSLERLLAEVVDLRREYGRTPLLDGFYSEVLLLGAESMEEQGRLDVAYGRFDELYGMGSSAEGWLECGLRTVELAKRLGEAAGEDSAKLPWYKQGFDRSRELLRLDAMAAEPDLRSRVEAALPGLQNAYVDLAGKAARDLVSRQRFEAALAELTQLEADLGGDVLGPTDLGQELTRLRDEAGWLELAKIPVAVGGTAVYGVAELELQAEGGGETRRDRDFFERLYWPYGTYDLVVHPPGEPPLRFPVSHRAGGSPVSIPERIPRGMVYVPAGGGLPHYFIDRMEVTVAEYRAFDPSFAVDRKFRDIPEDRCPVHGVPFEKAQAYAASVGKKLPTREQWLRAAFGDGSRAYPWGNDEPWEGKCALKLPRPKPVGSYPQWTSPFGVHDMAGNVWEWISDGFALGGSYDDRGPVSGDGKINRLKMPKPGPGVFSRSGPDFQREYDAYRIGPDKANETEVGFRCVIDL